MSRPLILIALCAGLAVPVMAREFSSADGSRKVEGEFLRYNAKTGKVTLRMGGRNSVMPATAFSQEDQSFFVEEQKKVDMKESVSVKVATKSRNERSEDAKGKKKVTKHTSFSFVVKNDSLATIDGMKLKYWVLIETDDKEARDTTITEKSEEVAVGSLDPGAETTINGPTVELKEEKGGKGKKGKSVSVYGAKAQLISPDGEELGSDTTSDRVQKYLDR